MERNKSPRFYQPAEAIHSIFSAFKNYCIFVILVNSTVMRTLLFGLLCLVLPGRAQNPLSTKFNAVYNLSATSDNSGNQTMELGNSVVVSGGLTHPVNGNSYSTISLLDTNGTLLSAKNYGFSNYMIYDLKKVIKKNNATFFGFGHVYNFNDPTNKMDLLMMKFDANGDTLFTKIYHDTGLVQLNDVIQYSPKDFLLLCTYTKNYNYDEYKQTLLVLVDTLGTISKMRYSPFSLYTPKVLLRDFQKNELYVLGTHKSQPGSSFYMGNYLRCLDDTSLQTKFIIPHITAQINDYLQGATFYQGAIYATYSSNMPIPPISNDGLIVKLAKMKVTGQNLVFTSNHVGPIDTSRSLYFGNVQVEKNKVIFPVFNNRTKQSFYFCDTTLNLICRANVPQPDINYECNAFHFLLTPHHRAISTGMCAGRLTNTASHWNFMSINYEAFILNGCSSPVGLQDWEIHQSQYRLYPNPSKGEIYLDNPEVSDQALELTVLNSLGACVYHQNILFRLRHKLELLELPPGLYICRLQTQTSQAYTIKFIKE